MRSFYVISGRSLLGNVLCFSRDAKLLIPAKNIVSIVHDLGYIKAVSCNATGTKVSFILLSAHQVSYQCAVSY